MVAELLIDFLCGAKERPPFEAPENQVKSLKKKRLTVPSFDQIWLPREKPNENK